MLDELNNALGLTRDMHAALAEGELDLVEQLGKKRDAILHECFPAGDLIEAERAEVDKVVQQIIQLNDEMIEIGNREKAAIQVEVSKEMKASSGIQKYIENM